MLKRIVQLAAAALILGGAALLISGIGAGRPALLVGAITLIAVRYERWRERTPPASASGWRATGERFQDPASGKTVEVHYNPATGERRYHAADGEDETTPRSP
jgi:hypothetical protein